MEKLHGTWLDQIGLQHFAEIPVEGPVEPPAGRADLTEAAIADTAVPEESPAFYEYTDSDGEKLSFKDTKALDEAFGNNFTRQKHFTKKTTELSEQSARVKTREAELEKHAEELKGVGATYKKFRDFMNARPNTYAKFKQMVELPPSPEEAFNRSQSYTDEQVKEMKSMMDEMKGYRADQEFETQKKALYKELQGEHSDFDPAVVEKILGGITDNPRALLELAYYSQRGRQDPVEMERRAAEALDKKRREPTGVIPGSGTTGKTKDFANLGDARRAAQNAV